MSAEPVVSSFTAQSAAEHTARLRASVDEMLDLVAEAWEGRIWLATGDANWKAYLSAHVPEIADLRLPVARRREVVKAWAAKGMSQPAMAAGLNTSPATINADVKAVVPADATAQVISLDGRRRTARATTSAPAPAPKPKVSKRDRIFALVSASGADGLTRNEIVKATGWGESTVSGSLSPMARQGRIRATAVFRDGCAAYVIAD